MYTVEGMALPLTPDAFMQYQEQQAGGIKFTDEERSLLVSIVNQINRAMYWSQDELIDFVRYCKQYQPERETTEWFTRFTKSLCWWSVAVYEAVHGEITA